MAGVPKELTHYWERQEKMSDTIYPIEIKTVHHDCANMPEGKHYQVAGELSERLFGTPPGKRAVTWGTPSLESSLADLLYCPWCGGELPLMMDLEKDIQT